MNLFSRSNRVPEKWALLAESVRGASHQRQRNIPNQDAFKLSRKSLGGALTAAAVSDGHGHSLHFRSDVGSCLAVEAMVPQLEKAAALLKNSDDSSYCESVITNYLPRMIKKSWRTKVLDHYKNNPLNADVIRLIDGKGSMHASVYDDPLIAYGCTLLGAAITDDKILFAQIGDGNILIVSADGTVKQVFEEDEDIITITSTDSLCSDNSDGHFKISVMNRKRSNPVLITLSTDGYCNSFKTLEGFLQTGSDYLRLLVKHGPDAVQKNLSGYLRTASEEGSGDDITLALMYRLTGQELKKHGGLFKSITRTLNGSSAYV